MFALLGLFFTLLGVYLIRQENKQEKLKNMKDIEHQEESKRQNEYDYLLTKKDLDNFYDNVTTTFEKGCIELKKACIICVVVVILINCFLTLGFYFCIDK